MKKYLALATAVSFLFVGCNNTGQSTSNNSADSVVNNAAQDTSAANSTEIFKQAVGKLIEPTKIPKYQVPKNQTKGANSGVEQLITDVPADCPVLTKITDLNSGAEFNIYKFDQSMQAGLQAMGFNGTLSRHEMVFIEDYVRYQICDKDKKRYGIGLRCYIHVTSTKGKMSYSSLPAIAANVELDRAKATFNIKSLGFAFDGSLLSGAPASGDYNVDDFGKLAVIFNNVVKTLTDDSKIKFSPVELPVPQQ